MTSRISSSMALSTQILSDANFYRMVLPSITKFISTSLEENFPRKRSTVIALVFQLMDNKLIQTIKEMRRGSGIGIQPISDPLLLNMTIKIFEEIPSSKLRFQIEI